MSKALITQSYLTNIANSIRTKLGVQTTYTPSQMSSAIDSIPSGGSSEEFIKVVEGGVANVSLPDGATRIKKFLFYQDNTLRTVNIPNSVTVIENDSFSNSGIASLNLPNSITSIGRDAFYYCGRLSTVTFEGTPTSIASSAFSGCGNLTTINVPWSQGTVANAPWGATGATINYNYTGA